MPRWGLTETLREDYAPWGIPAAWFKPGKVVTDPVKHDIYLNRLEQAIVDTKPFQRLRRVRQLGNAHYVYPGGTHTRFSHALGAVREVQDLFDIVEGQQNGRHVVDDLFKQWQEGGAEYYATRIAESMVLARLGALLHDFCHVPSGHSVEDDLKLLPAHDEGGRRFTALWNDMRRSLEKNAELESTWFTRGDVAALEPLFDGELEENLRPLILSKEKRDKDTGEVIEAADRIRYPFVADLVGNTICADLLDYLERDHLFTGLPLSLGARYKSEFYVTPKRDSVLYPERVAIRIHRNGRERPDVVTELLKHLRYRYELQERVLSHHTKIAADAMVGKMLDRWSTAMVEQRVAGGTDRKRAERAVERQLDKLLRESGDDTLLEHLARDRSLRRTQAGRDATTLASDLLERRLYRHVANASGAHAPKELHKKFGDRETRSKLELSASNWADLSNRHAQVLLWIPPPGMRLKLAEMLVDHGKGLAKFVDYSKKGREIYDDHRDLWNIMVFVHRSVSDEDAKVVLARLAADMGLCWDRYESELGTDAEDWPRTLAAMQACKRPEVDETVRELLEHASPSELARRRRPRRHKDLLKDLETIRDAKMP